MAVAGGVMQWRPAGFVDVRALLHHFLDKFQLAFERRQHQRAFTLRIEQVEVDIWRIDQDCRDFGGWLSQCYQQAVLAFFVQGVGVKPSRQQPLEPEALNLNTIVMSLVDLLNRTVGEGIAVETVTGAGLWLTLADANQIENTLLNLAINSRDAMDGQGKLSIETSNAYLDAAYVAQFSDLKAGPYVMLSVTDTGSGIAPDKLERVFEPFYTTKEPGKGTGLGLAMIYGFVKQSGGHVRIYSEVGQGTTVRLYLPRLPESQAVATAPRAMAVDQTPVPQAGAGEVILLVEDDPGVLEYAVGALEDLGYQVVSATGAVEALAKLADVPKLDMLFTDVVLGGQTNGKQLSRLVLEKLPDLPVLFTTGYTRNAIVHQGRLDEGVNLLNKPYSLRELAEKLRFVLSQRQGASAEG